MKTLSIIPYYGGKARMASFIAKRLDYSCDNFITLFGGACRVLLNKEPHKREFYNEKDNGLCTLMRVLSNKDTAEQLIDRLYYGTSPTEEQFNQSSELYDKYRYDLEEQAKKRLKKYFREYERKSSKKVEKELNDWWENEFQKAVENDEVPKEIDFPDKVTTIKQAEDMRWAWGRLKRQKEEIGLEDYDNMSTEEISDIDLAAAVYVTYTLSYSGIGESYVKGKFKTEEDYRKRILRLYECSDRLNGLQVWNIDALHFLCNKEKNNMFYRYLNDEKTMMFLDPPYLKWDEKEKRYKNLGSIYPASFGKEKHDKMLEEIKNAKCKILICNYNIHLYDDKLLKSEKCDDELLKSGNWHKEVYPTKTTVYNTSKSNHSNERMETIWYNY